MPETANGQQAAQQTQGQPQAAEASQGQEQSEQRFTQADVDRIISERLKRENVADLKTKAQAYDALQESSKSETQRLTEQIQKLTEAQARSDAAALRYRIAAAHGVTNEDADLFLTGNDEDTITAQAKRLADRDKAAKKGGPVVPGEGTTPSANTADAEARAFLRSLTGGS